MKKILIILSIVLFFGCSFDAYYPEGDFVEYSINGNTSGVVYFTNKSGKIDCINVDLPFYISFYSTKEKSLSFFADDNVKLDASIVVNDFRYEKTGIQNVSIAVP